MVSRRRIISSIGAAAGAALVAPRSALGFAQQVGPPSTITTPPRDFGPNAPPATYFTDPDVTVDLLFDALSR